MGTLTRQTFELILVRRLKQALIAASMSTQVDGSNPDLVDAMGYALRAAEYSQASPGDVTDADLQPVKPKDFDLLFDLGEYRALSTIMQWITITDERLGPHGRWNSQYPNRLQLRATNLARRLRRVYGIEAGTLTPGVIEVQTETVQDGS